MIEIKDLLLKSSYALLGEEIKIESIKNTIKEVLGVSIESKDIKIKNGTIFLNIKPIYKNEVLIKKEEILSKIHQVLGKKAPQHIR